MPGQRTRSQRTCVSRVRRATPAAAALIVITWFSSQFNATNVHNPYEHDSNTEALVELGLRQVDAAPRPHANQDGASLQVAAAKGRRSKKRRRENKRRRSKKKRREHKNAADEIARSSDANKLTGDFRDRAALHAIARSGGSADGSELPMYKSIVDERRNEIVGDLSRVLDFAIVGFPKCGTTTMTRTLGLVGKTPDRGDTCAAPLPLLKGMYHQWGFWDDGGDRNSTKRRPLRGIKCPAGVERVSWYLEDFVDHFRNAKLIVGIRHPVRWFESFYNFQVQNRGEITPPRDRIAGCDTQGSEGCKTGGCIRQLFCTNRARFHKFLAQLGKTPLSAMEQKLIPHQLEVHNISNPIFLYEVSQLSDEDATRRRKFWDDLGEYLGLDKGEIREDVWVKPGKTVRRKHKQEDRDAFKIDICDGEHDELRAVLQKHAVESARWIREYFLEIGRDVHASSVEHLKSILRDWETDPCDKPKVQRRN